MFHGCTRFAQPEKVKEHIHFSAWPGHKVTEVKEMAMMPMKAV
jgi:hypothetical protein